MKVDVVFVQGTGFTHPDGIEEVMLDVRLYEASRKSPWPGEPEKIIVRLESTDGVSSVDLILGLDAAESLALALIRATTPRIGDLLSPSDN